MKKKKKKKASGCTEHLSTARAIIHRHVRHSILLSDIIMSCGAFYHLVRHYIVLPEIISSSQILYCLVGHSINLSGIILSCQTFYTLVRHSIVLSDNLSRRVFLPMDVLSFLTSSMNMGHLTRTSCFIHIND